MRDEGARLHRVPLAQPPALVHVVCQSARVVVIVSLHERSEQAGLDRSMPLASRSIHHHHHQHHQQQHDECRHIRRERSGDSAVRAAADTQRGAAQALRIWRHAARRRRPQLGIDARSRRRRALAVRRQDERCLRSALRGRLAGLATLLCQRQADCVPSALLSSISIIKRATTTTASLVSSEHALESGGSEQRDARGDGQSAGGACGGASDACPARRAHPVGQVRVAHAQRHSPGRRSLASHPARQRRRLGRLATR